MVCEAVRPVIRQFMDDLLDEKDYQEVQTHLAACERCHAYASSVGTLSYRLHELGQASLPPDMVSVILHELKKELVQTEESPVFPQTAETSLEVMFNKQTRLFWVAIIALAMVSVTVAAGVFFRKSHAAPAVVMPPERLTEQHFHLTISERPELAELILELQLAVERDSERSLDFFVPAEKSAQFRERMASFSGAMKEFGESASAEGTQDERVTVFFE